MSLYINYITIMIYHDDMSTPAMINLGFITTRTSPVPGLSPGEHLNPNHPSV
jgi:hypothetical protein